MFSPCLTLARRRRSLPRVPLPPSCTQVGRPWWRYLGTAKCFLLWPGHVAESSPPHHLPLPILANFPLQSEHDSDELAADVASDEKRDCVRGAPSHFSSSCRNPLSHIPRALAPSFRTSIINQKSDRESTPPITSRTPKAKSNRVILPVTAPQA